MRLKSKVLLAILALASIGLAACEPEARTGPQFVGGTNALLIEFMEDAPPDLIFDNRQTPFSIIMKVTNDGEFDTRDVQFRLSGINTVDFDNLELDKEYTSVITGNTKLGEDRIDGEQVYVTLSNNVEYKRSLIGGGTQDYPIIVTACYPYATVASAAVCLQRDYLRGESEVCDPQTTRQISVSGAPIQIEQSSQQAVGSDRLRVQYTFSKRTSARIFAPIANAPRTERLGLDVSRNVRQDCHPSRTERIQEEDWIHVMINDNDHAGEMSCVGLLSKPDWEAYDVLSEIPQTYATGRSIFVTSPDRPAAEGYVRLGADGNARVTCTVTLPSGTTDSIGTFDVKAAYFVRDSAHHSLTVTHSG